MRTNLQVGLEKQRAVYSWLKRPLLAQICQLHGLTIRDISTIFSISTGHAANILNHKALPDLPLAFRLARYFETDVESLFGWLVDDDGSRRPLVIEVPGGVIRLSSRDRAHGSMALVESLAYEMMRREREGKDGGS